MANLESCHWQVIFGFLDVDTCENVTEVFETTTNQAFEKSIFWLMARKTTPPHVYLQASATSTLEALAFFKKYKKLGASVEVRNVRFKMVMCANEVLTL